MTLINKLNDDLKQAMKGKDAVTKNVIIMIKSAIKNQSIELKRDLTDDEIVTIVSRQVKQTNDAISDFHKAGREDLVDKAYDEIAVLQEYLPKQLTELEIENIVAMVVMSMNTNNVNLNQISKGAVMKVVTPMVKGKADGKLVSQIVDQFLEGK